MNCLDKLIELHKICHFQTKEGKRYGRASNSELRRWFQNKCVELNGIAVDALDECPAIETLVLFPKNKQRCTLY